MALATRGGKWQKSDGTYYLNGSKPSYASKLLTNRAKRCAEITLSRRVSVRPESGYNALIANSGMVHV